VISPAGDMDAERALLIAGLGENSEKWERLHKKRASYFGIGAYSNPNLSMTSTGLQQQTHDSEMNDQLQKGTPLT